MFINANIQAITHITIFNRLGVFTFSSIYTHKIKFKITRIVVGDINETVFITKNHKIANTEQTMKNTHVVIFSHFGNLTQNEYRATIKQKRITKNNMHKTVIANHDISFI